ncbi:hypothetical protein [Segniliparus rugosus]|uniref:DUF1634 domain-containing protein n=1 Tax=Segniliparus rugosus (strain ATCC BAA-974 / DSM 45345 / CCUG 50838 / CIP 108380 / JCM 13579 / CDC 945) TaxID=679197 RepID=E5XLL1_SEGRC|nr:hypothetical protein [Segniliparus rugosus]EFV14784.1 hypothetical protein HMPREF9336_00380 [Segniliparus rugosus ATCC BAA-974]
MTVPTPQSRAPRARGFELLSWASLASAAFAVVVSVLLFLRFSFLPLGAFGKSSDIDYDGVVAIRAALSALGLLPLVPAPLFLAIGLRGEPNAARLAVGLLLSSLAGLAAAGQVLHALIA